MGSRFFGLPKAKELLDSAVRHGIRQSSKGKKNRNKFAQLKKQHIVRIKEINNYLNNSLNKCLDSFPTFTEMPSFQSEMISTIIDLIELKKIISRLNKIRKLIFSFSRKYKGEITRAGSEKQIISAYKQFLGRLFSFEKDLNKIIPKLNKVISDLNKLPKIADLSTIILAGFPNTGKTTILSRLTKSKPKIAEYAFTTQDLMIGYMEVHYQKFQLIDTPGLLDKEKEKRNKIEQKTINALRHLAKAIFFVIDPTELCGFSLKKQLKLLKQLKEFKVPIIVIVNKTDIASIEQINAVKIKGKVLSGNKTEKEFREEIIERIKKLKL